MYVVLSTWTTATRAEDQYFEFAVSQIACPPSTAPSSEFQIRVLDSSMYLISNATYSEEYLWV